MLAACEDGGVSSTPSRYQRSAPALVGALVVSLAVILAFVAFRALTRDQVELKPEPVDYLGLAAEAQKVAPVVYPAALPVDWTATSVDYEPGDPPAWGVGVLTADGSFVGVRQEAAPLEGLLDTYVDKHAEPGSPATVPGAIVETWQTWSDSGGDRAYVATVGEDQVLVYGNAKESDLMAFLTSLTTDPLP